MDLNSWEYYLNKVLKPVFQKLLFALRVPAEQRYRPALSAELGRLRYPSKGASVCTWGQEGAHSSQPLFFFLFVRGRSFTLLHLYTRDYFNLKPKESPSTCLIIQFYNYTRTHSHLQFIKYFKHIKNNNILCHVSTHINRYNSQSNSPNKEPL